MDSTSGSEAAVLLPTEGRDALLLRRDQKSLEAEIGGDGTAKIADDCCDHGRDVVRDTFVSPGQEENCEKAKYQDKRHHPTEKHYDLELAVFIPTGWITTYVLNSSDKYVCVYFPLEKKSQQLIHDWGVLY